MSKVKLYVGVRVGDQRLVHVYEREATANPPDLGCDVRELRHVELHSPDGFEWNYGGSGPADLALSIMADFFGEKPTKQELYHGAREIPDEVYERKDFTENMDALLDSYQLKSVKYHQDFKQAFIANFPKDGWILTSCQIERWLHAQGWVPLQ